MSNHNLSHSHIEGIQVALVPTSLKNLVYITFSTRYGWYGRDESAAPFAASNLLQYGSKDRTRAEWFELFDSKRMSISVSVGAFRSELFISAFADDVHLALRYAEELLTECIYPHKEVQLYKERTLADYDSDMQNPAEVTEQTLRNALFTSSHPSYKYSFKELKHRYSIITRAQLKNWIQQFSMCDVCITACGDTRTVTSSMLRAFVKKFKSTPTGIHDRVPLIRPRRFKDTRTPISGKGSPEVTLAHHIPLYRDSLEMPALQVYNELLGGSFSSHLMQTVRVRDGLTYRAYSRLSDFSFHNGGFIAISSSFNTDVYSKGVNTLREEVEKFKAQVVNVKAVELAKENIITSILFSRQTTRGLGNAVHYSLEHYGDLSHLERSKKNIETVTVSDVNKVADFLKPELLTEFAAGSFKK